MPGFVVTFHPPAERSATDDSTIVDLPEAGITISQDGVESISTPENHVVLIDGYAIGVTPDKLAAALVAQDDALLSRLHGHYCALIIHPDGNMSGSCDRFGARTLFWRSSARHGIEIASSWEGLPVRDRHWDDTGLSETLRYRWMTGQATLVTDISSLPVWHRVLFRRSGEIRLQTTSQAITMPTRFAATSFQNKLDSTRAALEESMRDIARSCDNAAIFLSGGVDSALLAALAKARFKKCLLVSSVFPGDANPELEVAKAFAETLGLEHLLVGFDSARVEENLRELVCAKGGQINFMSIAMRQMIEAIPEDYPLLIYGEAADSLFGSNRFKRIETLLRRWRYANLLPAALLETISSLPSHRLRSFAALKKTPLVDIVLKLYQIAYVGESAPIARKLCRSNLDDIQPHRAVNEHTGSLQGLALRGFLQGITLRGALANHFRETGLAADRFGKKLYSPFMSAPVMEAAKTLSLEQYYGKSHVKPVLRELACEHYDRKLIYREKHGFEVPQIAWLKGPLSQLVEDARQERDLFDGRQLQHLDVATHYALLWSLINWQLINGQSAQPATGAF